MSEQWISVKDRLPEPKQPFWRYAKKAACGPPVCLYEEGVFDPRGHFQDCDLITHWMPATLPEPPKSEAERAFEKWADLLPLGGAISRNLAKCIFLAGWQAHEKRGEG